MRWKISCSEGIARSRALRCKTRVTRTSRRQHVDIIGGVEGAPGPRSEAKLQEQLFFQQAPLKSRFWTIPC